MSAPATHDPQQVTTRDGATWTRRAVNSAGRGLYGLAGGSDSAPELLLLTLVELAEQGIRPVTDVAEAVAVLGALPVPAGPLEDPHESPLHHNYRIPRDLPLPGDAAQAAAEMLADRLPTKGAS